MTEVCEKHMESFLCSLMLSYQKRERERALKGESLWRASHIHTVPLLLRAFTVTVLKRDRVSCCVKMALETSLRNRAEKDIRLRIVICQCTDQKTEMLYILLLNILSFKH